MNFDYLSLLFIASVIAGIGLATNQTVAIVASMLVSPIMGPVLALTFGSIIQNYELMKLGLFSELLSLLICIVIGFFIGLIAIGVGTDGLWPTDEMRGRGLVSNLAIGFAIAVPSGMGVALSLLGNNTSSLVGVAISASLLPPAVNCGIAFAYAAVGFHLDRGVADDDAYDSAYSYVNMGGVSLALTIVNIGAIYFSGLLMFRIKEVAPIKNKAAFWEKDTQVFRKYQQQQRLQYHTEKIPEVEITESTHMLKEVGRNRELRKQLLSQLKRESNAHVIPIGGLSTALPATASYHAGEDSETPEVYSLAEFFREAPSRRQRPQSLKMSPPSANDDSDPNEVSDILGRLPHRRANSVMANRPPSTTQPSVDIQEISKRLKQHGQPAMSHRGRGNELPRRQNSQFLGKKVV
jgi:uncharacterized hydrophobic protein (TIGR00271 family)